MTAAEKIKIFQSVEELISEIETDSLAKNDILRNRYAVRFIMLDSFDVFQELSLQLAALGVNALGLETLLSHKDGWITLDELKNTIKKISSSTIVSPFSEIVRFYDENKFTAFFNEIALLENSGNNLNRRIYIPLIGLESRFLKFLSSFDRIIESAPVWSIKTGVSQPVTIYLTPSADSAKSYSFPQLYTVLETMYDWLLFWKTKAPAEKIICSAEPINVYYKYSQPDNIFDIKLIGTAFEFIKQVLNIQINIDYETGDECFWIQLLSLIEDKDGRTFSFKTFVEKHFNVHKLSIEELLNRWTSSETREFDRWLLKYYYLHFIQENKYLNKIICDCVDYSSLKLFREIALSIFAETNRQSLITERNDLLKMFAQEYQLPESDLSKMKQYILDLAQTNTAKAIPLCSGRFDFEKELFVGWYKVGKLPLSELQNLYPDFADYMKDLNLEPWANAYIQAYKEAKVKDSYTEEIKSIIADKNTDEESFFKWYSANEFELSGELLAKEKVDKTYWIDGLGIEYLSLINEIISASNFQIEKLIIAKTGIPSSTEHNRFDDVIKINDLDSFIHQNIYQYPQTVCKEIEIVRSIFNRILNQSDKITIAIVSDHGLTSLSRLVDSKKYATQASHEGRYIKLDGGESVKDSDYIRHKNGNDNFKVALTHASLNTKPVREVHGGCTPEEILVPFIVISNKKSGTALKTIPDIKPEVVIPILPINKGFEEEELF